MEQLLQIGDYRLIASLGQGGMAQVYLGMAVRTTGFNKLLVLKVLRTDVNCEEDLAHSFLEEAKIAARLNHPNVVQTYEAGTDAGVPFLAMEYLEGQTLSALYAKVGRSEIPVAVQLRVICDLLDGLDYVHDLADYDGTSLNLVHRDVSPHNVILTYSGVSKLLDFGIARVEGMTKTQEGVIKGKVGYMAPEQICGPSVDRRADVFAVGVFLWEMLAERRMPTAGEGDMVIMSRRAVGADPKILTIRPDAPPELAAICDKAMSFDAKDRFATAREMRAAIEAYAVPNGLLADTRAVSALLRTHFTEHREKLNKRIDKHIKNDAASMPLLRLGVNAAGGSASGSLPRTLDGEVSGERTPSGSSDNSSSVVRLPPEKQRRSYALAGASAAVVTVAFVLLRSGSGGTPAKRRDVVVSATTPSTTSTPAAAMVETAPKPQAEAQAVVHIRLHVNPPSASVSLDGVGVQSSDLTLPHDGTSHTLAAQLAGYGRLVRTVDAVSDQEITLQLAPLVHTPSPGTPPPRPSSTAPTRSRREIEQDPYE